MFLNKIGILRHHNKYCSLWQIQNQNLKTFKIKNMQTNRSILTYITLIIFLFTTTNIFASVKITGTLKSNDESAIPFANIAFYKNQQLINGCTSDDQGNFEMTIENPDTYVMKVSHIMYSPYNIEEKVGDSDINLGIIHMETNSESLEEIKIVAQDVIQQADKDVIIMNEKYTKQVSNTEQLLQKLPSVTVNLINQEIKVGNKNNVLLMVDGIAKDEQYIRSISPSKIKKVEIIKNVTGRYANEYDAILNVITDKSLSGYSLYAEDFTYASFEDSYNDIVLNNLKFTYSYFTSKSNIYAGYTNRYNSFYLPENMKYNYDDDFAVIRDIDIANNLYSSSLNNVYMGADFNLNADHILSAELRYSFSPDDKNKQKNLSEISTYQSNQLLNQYEQSYETKAKNTNPYALLSYEGKLGEKNHLSAGATLYQNENTFTNTSSTDNSILTENGKSNKQYVDFYVEDKLTINNSISLNFNYNYKYQNTDNSYLLNSIQQPNNSNSLQRHNLGAYANFTFNDKSGIKIGCAVEDLKLETESKNQTRNSHQTVGLPYLSYHNNMSEVLALRLNYKVTTKNPSIDKLSPYTSVTDAYTATTGNPLLEPAYFHNISGTIDFAGGALVFEPYYQFGNNIIGHTGILGNDHVVNYTYDNTTDYEKYGFNASGCMFIDFDNKDQLYISLDVEKFWAQSTWQERSHNITDCQITAQAAYLSTKYNAMLAAVLQKSNVKRINTLGYDNGNNDFLALAIKKGLCKDMIELSINYITPYDGIFTTKIGESEKGTSFSRENFKDVSVVQNSFMFQIIIKLNKNKNNHLPKNKRSSVDNDKISTGLM